MFDFRSAVAAVVDVAAAAADVEADDAGAIERPTGVASSSSDAVDEMASVEGRERVIALPRVEVMLMLALEGRCELAEGMTGQGFKALKYLPGV